MDDDIKRRNEAAEAARRIVACDEPATCLGDCPGCERDKRRRELKALRGCMRVAFGAGLSVAIFLIVVALAIYGAAKILHEVW